MEAKGQIEIGVVLQGGGALGAYEYGAMDALLELMDKIEADGRTVRLAAVTGVSIGAINAACVVGAKDRADARRRLKSLWDVLALEASHYWWAIAKSDFALFGVHGFYEPRPDFWSFLGWTNFYDTHPQNFMQPARFRASHLFLAAPPETPSDVVETKQKTINSLAARIKQGEKLADVAAAASEDEATKTRGGDLVFFSESRMPLDFFYAVVEMHVGEISQPIRTRLGFHVVEVTDFKPARQMRFEKVQPEIRLRLRMKNAETHCKV